MIVHRPRNLSVAFFASLFVGVIVADGAVALHLWRSGAALPAVLVWSLATGKVLQLAWLFQ